MKIKKGFLIRKVGEGYVAVAVGAAGKDFNGLININAAGAWIWEQMKEEISETDLVARMLARYEDLDRETAEADLKEFLESIAVAVE